MAKRFIVCAWILLLPNPALSNFYNYPEWQRLSPVERAAYIAGAFNSLISYHTDDIGAKASAHYFKCMQKSNMNNMQLAENVSAFASTRPNYRETPFNML